MPRIDENQDGTKTFSIDSSELGALRSLAQLVPDLDRVLDFLRADQLRSTLSFIRDIADAEPSGAGEPGSAARPVAVDAG